MRSEQREGAAWRLERRSMQPADQDAAPRRATGSVSVKLSWRQPRQLQRLGFVSSHRDTELGQGRRKSANAALRSAILLVHWPRQTRNPGAQLAQPIPATTPPAVVLP